MAQDIIIDIRNVSKHFDGKVILEDINLQIRKGEFVTFLGPSGCGKTTLLKIIGGFKEPDQGSIYLNGKDLTGVPPYERPLNTVFQRYALFPHLDVYENIAFGLKLKNVPDKEIDKRVRKMLKLVSLTDYEQRDVDSLSGGQQQRVAIARALANSPQVLLLDEPLSALDRKMRLDMQIELKEMHDKLGITFIYVTHDQEEALTLSDRIIVINEGRIQQTGTPADIYNEPCNSFVANFIGDSNILNGTMIRDRKVNFIGHDFDCIDEGFGENTPVDVVVRPEDIYIMNRNDSCQFNGVVRSCTFKGVHYEMFVDTEEGYEMQIQDYNAFEPGTEVGMLIKPQDIQVMKKDCVCNSFDAEVLDENHVTFLGGRFECKIPREFKAGDTVCASVAFDKVGLMDYADEGELVGRVRFPLYKGDHYHLEIVTAGEALIYADTQEVYDNRDLVAISIAPKDIKISAKK
ncbi:MAG: ABC transporter ATP-binding protein [Bacteroidales bacterium]|nr:ABC transporter ATP-binding protein [Bacteroidales bacterium]